MPRVVSLAERRDLLLRRSELSTIAQLPSWDVLLAVIEEQVELIKRSINVQAMSDRGISLEQQAYERGRIRGLRAAASIPRNALNKQMMDEMPTEQEVAANE